MKTVLIFCCSLFFVGQIFSQDGYLEIHKDDRIDQLSNLYSQHYNAFDEVPGFRIQIMATTNREKASKAEKDLKYKYSFETYLTFKSPYFKLRMGNFTDKLEAFRILKAMQEKYSGAFMVEEMVEFNPY